MEDLRDWLQKAEQIGELQKVDGADWNLEIGGLLDPKVGKRDTSALLFDNIKDYPEGYRILASIFQTMSRVALILNLPQVSSDRELVEVLRQKLPQWEAESGRFPPQVVKSGPVLQNVHSGAEIDLFEFPTPIWHELDGGRYIGTGDAVITRDPDTGAVNLGTYRVMIHDKKTVGLHIGHGHHGRIHYEKYHARGEACPVAVSIGHHPLIFGVACLPFPGCEYNFAGAIRGAPVDVIEEEVTGLPIPADGEIVIAGWCPPDKMRDEGPFGEWTGYYGVRAPMPVIEVERIYHRDQPVMTGAPPGRCPSDYSYFVNVVRSAMLHNNLIKYGIPDIRGVWLNEAVGFPFITISIKQRYAGHAKQAALIASQVAIGLDGKYVIAVDEDIDPTNIQDVIWALSFRTEPERDIDIIRRCVGMMLDPMLSGETVAPFNSRGIIDACRPYERLNDFHKAIEVPPELADRVRRKWKYLF